jgi:hypothetical protein
MKIGLAMSTYNRPDDVRWNVDLVRRRWPSTRHEYRLILTHNNPGLRDEFKSIEELDIVIEGKDLPAGNKPQIRCRQVNCWQTGIRAGLLDRCDWVVHFHADAYILRPDWLEDYVELLASRGVAAAGRGYGLDHRGPKVPEGDVDDHFFLVSQRIGDSFFDEPDELTMGVYASEGYLATRMRSAAGENYEHYDDLSGNEHDRIPRSMHPFNYDPARFLLHTPDPVVRDRYLERAYADPSTAVR